MKVAVALMLCLCQILALEAHGQWAASGQGKREDLAAGAALVRRVVTGPAGTAELKLVFFDDVKCELRVIDQPDRSRAGSLGDAMRALPGAVAGCNAGYFAPDFSPLGLVISQGQRRGALQKSSLLGGLIVVRKGRPRMVWRDEFVDGPGATDLVQAGPRLVIDAQPVKGLEATKRRVRTFVLTDGKSRWALGTSSRLSLAELSAVLAAPGVIAEFRVARAMNLDGGSSTGLWVRHAGGSESYDSEFSTVRNFLAVLPRK